MDCQLRRLDHNGVAWAQAQVAAHHYLRAPVPRITRPEAWAIELPSLGPVGCLIVCRPQATRCRGWYGGLDDVQSGWAPSSRWAVLNLARVWISPGAQPGGAFHAPEYLPGFVDRRGVFRSTLASEALRLLAVRVGFEYLVARPPCFLDEPYEHEWLLSYCETRRHRGVIYRAAGWELYRTAGTMQTWRVPLPALTAEQHAAIRRASLVDPRARLHRQRRAARSSHQMPMPALGRAS
jgi:hypothetical protein